MTNKGSLFTTIIAIVLFISLVIAAIVFYLDSKDTPRKIYYTNPAGHQSVKVQGTKDRVLDLSYDQIMASIESSFDMKKGRSVDGQDNYYGKNGDVSLRITCTSGNRDEVVQASITLYGIHNDTGAFNHDSLLIVNKFLNNIFPNWKDADKEIIDQINSLRLKSDIVATIIRDNKRIDFKYLAQPNMIVGGLILVIEPL